MNPVPQLHVQGELAYTFLLLVDPWKVFSLFFGFFFKICSQQHVCKATQGFPITQIHVYFIHINACWRIFRMLPLVLLRNI